MYAVGKSVILRKVLIYGFDIWRAKVKRNRWINEKADNKITRMTAGDYCSIISQIKKSPVLMCGAKEKTKCLKQ